MQSEKLECVNMEMVSVCVSMI